MVISTEVEDVMKYIFLYFDKRRRHNIDYTTGERILLAIFENQGFCSATAS